MLSATKTCRLESLQRVEASCAWDPSDHHGGLQLGEQDVCCGVADRSAGLCIVVVVHDLAVRKDMGVSRVNGN